MRARTFPCKNEAGFSLVEMLAALTIVALASVMVAVTLPTRQATSIKASVDQVKSLLLDMSKEAIVSGRAIGMIADGNQLSLVAWQDGTWRPLTSERFELDARTHVRITPYTLRSKNWPPVTVDEMGVYSPASVEVTMGGSTQTFRLSAAGLETGGDK